jgi:hypothetical protein
MNRFDFADRWMGVVVVAACCALGGPGRTSTASDHSGGGGHGESSGHSAPAPAASEATEDITKSGSNGMELGQFRIRAYYPSESQKSMATFALYATTGKDRLSDSRHQFENRQHKLRDQVIMVTRLMPLGDFNDPELKSFRRRLLLQLRRTLPELAIDNVYISDFELSVERI